MYGTAEFQISTKTNGKVANRALKGTDGEKVGKGLCRMLVTAITGIDDRNGRVTCRNHRSAFLGMAHGTDVCKAGDNADRIGYAFSLCGRRGVGIGKSEHASTKI